MAAANPTNAAGAAVASISYRDLFLDSTNDPYAGNYAGIMGRFTTTLQPLAASHGVLLRSRIFATAERELQAYLIVTHVEGRGPVVQVLHRPSVLHAPLDSLDDDERFGFMGDTRHGQPPMLVHWPGRATGQTNSVNVLSDTGTDTVLTGDPDLVVLGPFPDAQAGVEAVTTLRSMYLPPKYVPIALGRQLAPRQAWDEIGGLIRNEHTTVTEDLRPILTWLKCTLTRWDATDVPANHLDMPRPPSVFTTAHQDRVHAVLRTDLPTTNDADPTPVAGLTPLVAAVNLLTSEVVQTRTDEAVRRATGSRKSPDQYYGTAVLTLYRLAHVTSADQLPPIYEIIANTTKKHLRSTLEVHLLGEAQVMGQDQYTPFILPDLATKLADGRFRHFNPDDLAEGIQPFITPAWTPQECADLVQNVGAYDALMDGAAAQLPDIMAMRSMDRIRLPRSVMQAGFHLRSFRILLHSLLGGPSHPLVAEFDQFIHEYQQNEAELESLSVTPLYPTQILRWVQLRVSGWFNQQLLTPGLIPAPDLCALFDKVRHREPWQPTIPPRYLPRAPPPAAQARAPTHTPAPTPGLRAPPPAARPPAAPDAARRERVANPTVLPAYQQFRDSAVTLSDVWDRARAADDDIPHNREGVEHCMSFHCLGFCWSNCTRVNDHRVQDAAETAALSGFVNRYC
jgi:hypothetical protein